MAYAEAVFLEVEGAAEASDQADTADNLLAAGKAVQL